jgi:hypothetical protein
MEDIDLPRLALRKTEAANALGISVDILDKWIEQGQGPPHFCRDELILFPAIGLISWMNEQCDKEGSQADLKIWPSSIL